MLSAQRKWSIMINKLLNVCTLPAEKGENISARKSWFLLYLASAISSIVNLSASSKSEEGLLEIPLSILLIFLPPDSSGSIGRGGPAGF
jgi:hypothetical protein